MRDQSKIRTERGGIVSKEWIGGFVSAWVLLAGLVIGSRVADHSSGYSDPEWWLELYQTPLLSIGDVFSLALFGVLVGLVIIIPKYMPMRL